MSDTEQSRGKAATEAGTEVSVLDTVWAETENRKLSSDVATTRTGMEYLLSELLRPEREAGEAVEVDLDAVDSLIANIDARIGSFMDGILHHEEFQKLESAWRGLWHLVDNTDFREKAFIDVLHVTREQLDDDIKNTKDITYTDFYNHVYVEHMGQFGGEPYGAIVANYQLSHVPKDMSTMSKVAQVAAMAHAPFIAAASPQMFGLERFTDFNTEINEVAEIFRGDHYAAWNSFRERDPNARYVGLTVPQFMLRHPYNADSDNIRTFNYTESASSDPAEYLWGNAAFAFGARLTQAFAKSGWCVDIIGPRSGGAVSKLPQHVYQKDGRTETMVSTGLLISDRREKELSEQGFIPLVMRKDSDEAVFFSASSLQSPAYFGISDEGKEQEADHRLGTELPYLLMVSRLAHGLKVNQREHLGSWKNRSDIEEELRRWLKQYVSDQESPNARTRSQKPLRRADIKVSDFPGHAGWYLVDMQVMPHFKYQGADFTLSLRSRLDFDNKSR